MANYDDVLKYEQIADNSYGTAQEKMLAYTDSLEAAQKRAQNGLENFSIMLDDIGVIKEFYNAIGFATKNFLSLTTTIGAFLAISKRQQIGDFLSGAANNLGIRAMSFGMKSNDFMSSIMQGNIGEAFSSGWNNFVGNLEDSYTSQLKQHYNSEFINFMGDSYTDDAKKKWIDVQNSLLFNDKLGKDSTLLDDLINFREADKNNQVQQQINILDDKIRERGNLIGFEDTGDESIFSGTESIEELNAKREELVGSLTSNINATQLDTEGLLTSLTTDENYVSVKNSLISANQGLYNSVYASTLSELQAKGATDAEAQARRAALKAILNETASSEQLALMKKQQAQLIARPSALYNAAIGVFSTAGMLGGGAAAGAWAGEKFGDTGKVMGTMIGAMIGQQAVTTIMTAIPKMGPALSASLATGGITKVFTTAITAAVANPLVTASIVAVAALAFMGFNALGGAKKKKELEKQAKEFEEESDKYQNMLSASVDASKLDELSKGVDNLGKNVSLTDEEYKEFLDLNTRLGQIFPSLISHTDEQGQVFLTASEGASSLAESIDALVKSQQSLADQALLKPEIFEETWNKAAEQYEEAKEQYESVLKASKLNSNSIEKRPQRSEKEFWQDENGKDEGFSVEIYDGQAITLLDEKLKQYNDNQYDAIIGPNGGTTYKFFEDGPVSLQEFSNLIESTLEEVTSYYSVAVDGMEDKATELLGVFEENGIHAWIDNGDLIFYGDQLDKAQDLLEDFSGGTKIQLGALKNQEEQAKLEIKDEVQAIIRELENGRSYSIWDGFDTDAYNKLTDEQKSFIKNNTFKFVDLDVEGAEGEQHVAELVDNLRKVMEKDSEGLFLRFGLEYDGTTSYDEYVKGREDLVRNLLYWLPTMKFNKDQTKRFMLDFGFNYIGIEGEGEYKFSNYIDNKNYRKLIKDKGLEELLDFDLDAVVDNNGNKIYDTPDALKEIYEYLNSIKNTYPKLLSEQELFNNLIVSKYNSMKTKELVQNFNLLKEQIEEAGNNVTTFSKVNLETITKQMIDLAKALNLSKTDSEYIVSTLNRIPDINMDGTMEASPEEITEIYSKYKDLYEYLNTDFNGIWDTDKLNEAIALNDSFITNLISTPDKLKTELANILKDGDKIYELSLGNKLGTTEQGYKYLLEVNKEYVEKINDQYGIDLTQYTNLQEAKLQAHTIFANNALSTWSDIATKLSQISASETKDFITKQKSKISALGPVLTSLGLAKDEQEGIKKAESRYNAVNQDLIWHRGGGDTRTNDEIVVDSFYQEYYNNFIKKQEEDLNNLLTGVSMAPIKTGSLADISDSDSGSGSGSDFEEKLQSFLDKLKNYRNLIDKEWEAMLSWDENRKIETGTKYFEKMRENLTQTIDATKSEMDRWRKSTKNGLYYDPDTGERITQKEWADQINTFEADLITTQKELNNLDEEQAQDQLKILETKKEILDFDNERLGLYQDYNDYLTQEDNAFLEQLDNLKQQRELALKIYNTTVDTEEEHYEAEKRLKEVNREISDLIYEQLELRQKTLESVDASIYTMIDIQSKLTMQSRTQEELIENQNTLNDLLEQERDLRKQIAEFNQENAERNLEYLNSSAYSNSNEYDNYFNISNEELQKAQDVIWESWNAAVNKAYRQYQTEIDELTGQRKYTDEEAYDLAYYSEDAMSKYSEWMDKERAKGEKIVERVNARIAELDKEIELFNSQKPEEWSKYGLIGDFGTKQVDLLENKIKELKSVLNDVSELTDSQIEELVDQYNSAAQELYDLQKTIKQEQIDYQDNMFSALEWYIGEQKNRLEEMKNEIDDYYDDLLPPLEKEIADRQDLVELLELENQLKNAQEKQRVYRQGLGWVYESDHKKQREAQRQLDDYKLQQNVDDLENARNKEKEVLDDIIEQWDLYLQALQYKHSEHERHLNELYLQELTGAQNMEEVHNIITSDWRMFNDTCEGEYRNYIGTFSEFLNDYHKNLDELMVLNQKTTELLNPQNYLSQNDDKVNTKPEFELDERATIADITAQDAAIIRAAQRAYQLAEKVGDENAKRQAHEIAEQVRAKYGYSGGLDGSDYVPISDNSMYRNNIKEMLNLTDVKLAGYDNAIMNMGYRYNTWTSQESAFNATERKLLSERENNWSKTTTNVSNSYSKENANLKNFVNTNFSNLTAYDRNGQYQAQINNQIVNEWANTVRDENILHDRMTMNFDDFIAKYRSQIQEYANLVYQLQELQQMANDSTQGGSSSGNPDDLFPGSGSGSGSGSGNDDSGGTGSGSGSGGTGSLPDPSDEYNYIYAQNPNDANTLKMYQELYTQYKEQYNATSDAAQKAELQRRMDLAHEYANEIRRKYNLPTYAKGIENGAVTYTGLAMLHGTPSEPEYVLNNKQAENLLYNISRSKLPEYTRTVNTSSSGPEYNLYGDIVIDGASDPREFWNNVTKTMNNRSVVTKNK